MRVSLPCDNTRQAMHRRRVLPVQIQSNSFRICIQISAAHLMFLSKTVSSQQFSFQLAHASTQARRTPEHHETLSQCFRLTNPFGSQSLSSQISQSEVPNLWLPDFAIVINTRLSLKTCEAFCIVKPNRCKTKHA